MPNEPWVVPLLEKAKKETRNFDEAEKKYFLGMVQYAIDSGNQSEAEALAGLISDIHNHQFMDTSELARYIGRAFQKAGKEAIVKLVIK